MSSQPVEVPQLPSDQYQYPNDDELVKTHRLEFYHRAYGDVAVQSAFRPLPPAVTVEDCRILLKNLSDNMSSTSSKTMDPPKYLLILFVVKNYGSAGSKFRKEFRVGSNWVNQYEVVDASTPNGDPALYRLVQNQSNNEVEKKEVVHHLKAFDVIHAIHVSVGHQKLPTTKATVQQRYYNITEREVQTFIDLCPICARTRTRVPKRKGARKPIESGSFRDRFQIDLISYTGRDAVPDPDHPDRKFQYIVNVKDHFTKLVFLKALHSKEATEVARVLIHHLCFVGSPRVFHTDGGTEFTAQQLRDQLLDLDPSLKIIVGRPRQPTDQGSVERSNRIVRDLIDAHVLEANLKFQRQGSDRVATWVDVLPFVMQSMNISVPRQPKPSFSPYEHVFGMPMYAPHATSQQLDEQVRSHQSDDPPSQDDQQVDDQQVDDLYGRFHNCYLNCKHCRLYYDPVIVPLPADQFYDGDGWGTGVTSKELLEPRFYWIYEYCFGVISLEFHRWHPTYAHLVYPGFDNEQLSPKQLITPQHQQIFTLLCRHNHFCLVVVHLDIKKIEVFDGLSENVDSWMFQIFRLLQQLGNLPLGTYPGPDAASQQILAEYSVQLVQPIQQTEDFWNCGPIACATVLLLLHDYRYLESLPLHHLRLLLFDHFYVSLDSSLELLSLDRHKHGYKAAASSDDPTTQPKNLLPPPPPPPPSNPPSGDNTQIPATPNTMLAAHTLASLTKPPAQASSAHSPESFFKNVASHTPSCFNQASPALISDNVRSPFPKYDSYGYSPIEPVQTHPHHLDDESSYSESSPFSFLMPQDASHFDRLLHNLILTISFPPADIPLHQDARSNVSYRDQHWPVSGVFEESLCSHPEHSHPARLYDDRNLEGIVDGWGRLCRHYSCSAERYHYLAHIEVAQFLVVARLPQMDPFLLVIACPSIHPSGSLFPSVIASDFQQNIAPTLRETYPLFVPPRDPFPVVATVSACTRHLTTNIDTNDDHFSSNIVVSFSGDELLRPSIIPFSCLSERIHSAPLAWSKMERRPMFPHDLELPNPTSPGILLTKALPLPFGSGLPNGLVIPVSQIGTKGSAGTTIVQWLEDGSIQVNPDALRNPYVDAWLCSVAAAPERFAISFCTLSWLRSLTNVDHILQHMLFSLESRLIQDRNKFRICMDQVAEEGNGLPDNHAKPPHDLSALVAVETIVHQISKNTRAKVITEVMLQNDLQAAVRDINCGHLTCDLTCRSQERLSNPVPLSLLQLAPECVDPALNLFCPLYFDLADKKLADRIGYSTLQSHIMDRARTLGCELTFEPNERYVITNGMIDSIVDKHLITGSIDSCIPFGVKGSAHCDEAREKSIDTSTIDGDTSLSKHKVPDEASNASTSQLSDYDSQQRQRDIAQMEDQHRPPSSLAGEHDSCSNSTSVSAQFAATERKRTRPPPKLPSSSDESQSESSSDDDALAAQRKSKRIMMNSARSHAQAVQGEAMKRLHNRHVQNTYPIGTIVTLRIDPRDRVHGTNVSPVAVVYALSKTGGSAKVVCVHGIIGTRNKKPMWVPTSNLSPGKNPVVVPTLAEIRQLILNGSFNEHGRTVITVPQAHRLDVARLIPRTRSPQIPQNRCQCRSGCKDNRCPCRKSGSPCTFRCGCVNCSNNNNNNNDVDTDPNPIP